MSSGGYQRLLVCHQGIPKTTSMSSGGYQILLVLVCHQGIPNTTIGGDSVCYRPLSEGGCLCNKNINGRLMVHCYGKKLNEIPKDVPKNVTRLDVTNTNISILRNDSLNEYPNLQVLNLENNNIQDIESAALYPVPELTHLSLKNNGLTKVGFLKVQRYNRLEYLDLSFNSITSVDREALRDLKFLKFIRLTGNPLHCGCELAYFKQWIEMRRTWFRIQLIDALCVDRNNTPLSQVSTFKNCTGLRRAVRVTTKVTLHKFVTKALANEYEKENKAFDNAVRNELTSEVNKKIPSSGQLRIGIVSLGPPNVTISVDWTWVTTYDYDTEFLMSVFNQTFMAMDKILNSTFDKDSVEIFDTAVCQSSATENSKGGFYWPAIHEGQNATLYCPADTERVAYRTCTKDVSIATWKSPSTTVCPDLYPQTTTTADPSNVSLLMIDIKNINEVNADAMAEALYNISLGARDLTVEELRRIIVILESLVALKGSLLQGRRQYHMVGVLSNLYNTRERVLLDGEIKYRTSSRYLKIVNKLIDETDIADGDMMVIHPNTGLLSVNVNINNYNGTLLSVKSSSTESLSKSMIRVDGDKNIKLQGASAVNIPPSALMEAKPVSNKNPNDKRVALAIQKDSTIIEPIRRARGPWALMKESRIKAARQRVVNSAIFNVRVPGYQVSNLTDPVKFRFQPITENGDNASCEFFVDPESMAGGWSRAGCHVTSLKKGEYVECSCNHLTNFALIMDVYGVGEKLSVTHRRAMSYISYLGCALSLLALLLTLLTYMMFRKLRSNSSSSRGRQKTSNPAKIFINLCCSIAASNIVFLIGEQEYSLQDETGCKIVAALLHFCLLCSISWMSIEGFYMYKALVKVFNTHFSYFLFKTCLVGYGVPLLIVIITAGVNKTSNYGYQPGDICWLSTNAFFGAFLAPVCAMLIFNFIVFVLVLRKIMGNSGKKLNKSDKTRTSQRLRRAFTLVSLFGLTWIFAVFATDGAGIIFQYLFAISNSLQGFFIFIFNILLNKAAILQWKMKLLGRGEEVSKLTSRKVASFEAFDPCKFSIQRETQCTTCPFDSATYASNPSQDRRVRFQNAAPVSNMQNINAVSNPGHNTGASNTGATARRSISPILNRSRADQSSFGYRKSIVKPATYDGKSSWIDFKSHFDICADLNEWTNDEKGMYLAVALRGGAQAVLGNLPAALRKNFTELCRALEYRYAPANQMDLYRAQLKDRKQKASESVPELGQDVRRLTNLAYAKAPSDVRETLAMEYFIDALHSSDMRLRIKQSRPKSLNEAVCLAVELDDFNSAEKSRQEIGGLVRATDSSRGNDMSPIQRMVDETNKALADMRKEIKEMKESQTRTLQVEKKENQMRVAHARSPWDQWKVLIGQDKLAYSLMP
ncbi:hypothetical protein FSP39_025425 [Pinctada imbricata]|uniref:Uncharacterized protein n=1 Tax=Pinctada imbricata TaxID=66713 RepID=A0AA88XGW6_PINIB|nr:hypothetical protein FSP39_025425 [Pinctada imbricata]